MLQAGFDRPSQSVGFGQLPLRIALGIEQRCKQCHRADTKARTSDRVANDADAECGGQCGPVVHGEPSGNFDGPEPFHDLI